jgi:hypothetical protein
MEFFAPINEFRAANNGIAMEILAGAECRRKRGNAAGLVQPQA